MVGGGVSAGCDEQAVRVPMASAAVANLVALTRYSRNRQLMGW
jgi:hypothetical protein